MGTPWKFRRAYPTPASSGSGEASSVACPGYAVIPRTQNHERRAGQVCVKQVFDEQAGKARGLPVPLFNEGACKTTKGATCDRPSRTGPNNVSAERVFYISATLCTASRLQFVRWPPNRALLSEADSSGLTLLPTLDPPVLHRITRSPISSTSPPLSS